MAEMSLIVPFPDGSPSFVHGFEAGMIWQRMQDGEAEIRSINCIPYHVENEAVFRAMAAACGYDVAFSPVGDGWMHADFTKRVRPRFSVVQGGTDG